MERRTFLSGSVLTAAAALTGCSADGAGTLLEPEVPPGPGPGPNDLPPGVTVTGKTITIAVAQVPGLAAAGGFLAIPREQTIVLNLGAGVFRAFTNVCTHAGCGVNAFVGSRMRCPCHGSEYDTAGRVVQGPAELPLLQFPAVYDAASGRLTVTKV